MKLITVTALTLMLAGCATPYQESNWLTGGVSAQRISADTLIITASGNSSTSADTIKLYTLRRASEESIKAGYDWFVILDSADRSSSSTFVQPGQSTSYTTGQATALGNTAFGTATTNTYTTPGMVTNLTTPGLSSTVRMGSGPKPANGFNARETLSYLAPAK